MKEFIKNRLTEALNIPSFRLPKNVEISSGELEALKRVNWTELKIKDLGGSGNIAHMAVKFPFKTNASNGIVIDIQVLHDLIYQIHLHMFETLQNIGLGYKIYKALINDLGHLYSGKGRRMNPYITKIWEKLKDDNDFICLSNENGDLCMIKNNPNKEELMAFMH